MFNHQQGFAPNDVFLLEHITYIPLGNQNPMYNRPMTVIANEHAMNKITESMLSTGANRVSANMVADVVSGIIQPSAVAQASVIDNMWVGHILSQPLPDGFPPLRPMGEPRQ